MLMGILAAAQLVGYVMCFRPEWMQRAIESENARRGR